MERTLIITHRQGKDTTVSFIRSEERRCTCAAYTPTAASLQRVARIVNAPRPQPGYSFIPWFNGISIAYTV